MSSPFAELWTLDSAVAYLNHGSFGACPRPVLQHQAALRARMEKEPVDFLARDLDGLLAAARGVLGPFVGADPDDLAFVSNATGGVNAVLLSLALKPGDELLTTTHAYAACRKTLLHAAARTGARVVIAQVPFPLRGADGVVEPVLAAVTERTRLALIDHVTSPTAVVFPVERLVRELRARGVESLIDGAHAPGMVPIDIGALGAAFYTGNAHKWLCAPKGAAFLHVRRDLQEGVHPLVISHGYQAEQPARFRAEFDWTGTDDPTAWLSVAEAIRLLGTLLPGGWPALRARNHALALEARDLVCSALGVDPPVPDAMLGSMASIALPAPAKGAPAEGRDQDQLARWFRERGVESWFSPAPAPRGPRDAAGMMVRVSAQLYNDGGQYVRLSDLLREALGVR